MRERTRAGLIAIAACVGLLLASVPAQGAVPASLRTAGALGAGCITRDAADDDVGNGNLRPYVFCNDGTPTFGGLNPADLTGTNGVLVPAKYGADGFTGLPLKALDAATMPGANAAGDVGLDVDVSLPTTTPPAGGYPMILMMHGCCSGNRTSWEAATIDQGGERWHYSNAWFASRGYVVVNYTARGFVNNQSQGSSGQTQLDSRSFEINDGQALACNVLDTANGALNNWDALTGVNASVDPLKVVVTGGSYGGGFSWLALTDPKWQCNADTGAAGTNMALAAAAPKYGWTDLAYTLVPNGTHSELPSALPETNGCSTGPLTTTASACPGGGAPVGIPKSSIVGILYLTGNQPTGDHTTFGQSITESFGCLQGVYPLELNPACGSTLNTILPEFLRERSAYYQNDFFANIAGDPSYRVPIFNAGTLTDPLFPAYENRRMANRLQSVVPDYPIKQFYGDYQHFVQNKPKEWGDLCGGDRHVCTLGEYAGGDVNLDPAGLVRTGVTTRLNKFIDNYALPLGGYGAVPANVTPDVTASLQICPDNAASSGVGTDQPGELFNAGTFESLAPNNLSAEMPGAQSTTSKMPDNPHAIEADPVGNFVTRGGVCPVHNPPSVSGLGIASYSTTPLPTQVTMIGATRLNANFTVTPAGAQGFQLNARLYDVFPGGKAVLVDRGPRRITNAEMALGAVAFELHGNGWRFPQGHQIRVEIAQDDEPFVKASSVPSSATLSRAHLDVPIREPSFSIGGGPDDKGACINTLATTRRADRLTGTGNGDVINGGRGKDRLDGFEGRDCVRGQADKDRVKGGAGADTVTGGPSDDKVVGGAGADFLAGGGGNDKLKARDGERDTVKCGSGKDRAKVDRIDKVTGCETVRGGKKRKKGKKGK